MPKVVQQQQQHNIIDCPQCASPPEIGTVPGDRKALPFGEEAGLPNPLAPAAISEENWRVVWPPGLCVIALSALAHWGRELFGEGEGRERLIWC